MAKGIRKAAWDDYLKKSKAGQKKKGTPLVSWGKLSVDLDRLDTAVHTQLPGGQVQQVDYLSKKTLDWLVGELKGKKTNEIEIYDGEVKGRIAILYWHVNSKWLAKKGQGPVDFEGSATKVIVDKLEEIYTSGGEAVEEIRKRDQTGGFVLEHGSEGGTGGALVTEGTAGKASKKIRGLKAQKEVISALRKAFSKTPPSKYLGYMEAAIFDWMDVNFNLTNEMKKNRSIKDIDDLWQGEATITLGQKVVPGTTVPANSRKVDNVIRKEFKKWIRGKEFLKDILKHVKHLPIKERLKVFSASEPVDDAFLKYGAGAFAAVFTKSGKLDKRYKINKKLLAKADKKKNTVKSKNKTGALNSIVANKAAKGSKSKSRQRAEKSAESPLVLMELINATLSDEILDRMHPPALQNRTGRFRRSAKVTNVLVGPKGGTEIQYTYMKMPYQTFEPGYAQGSTTRDPRKIIGESIREIAQELMGKKFIKVRRV